MWVQEFCSLDVHVGGLVQQVESMVNEPLSQGSETLDL